MWAVSQDQFGFGELTRDGLIGRITFDATNVGFTGDQADLMFLDVGGNDTFFVESGGASIAIPAGLPSVITIEGGPQ